MTIARMPAAFAIRASSSASSLRGVPSGAACACMSIAPSSVWARPTAAVARAQNVSTANDTARIASPPMIPREYSPWARITAVERGGLGVRKSVRTSAAAIVSRRRILGAAGALAASAAMPRVLADAAGGVSVGMRAYTAIFPGGAGIRFDDTYYRDQHLAAMQR